MFKAEWLEALGKERTDIVRAVQVAGVFMRGFPFLRMSGMSPRPSDLTALSVFQEVKHG